jgi:hypothetical protein
VPRLLYAGHSNPGTPEVTLTEHDEITGEDALPGFTAEVGDLLIDAAGVG